MKGGPLGQVGGMLRTGVMVGGLRPGTTETGSKRALPWFHAAVKLQQHKGWSLEVFPALQPLRPTRQHVRQQPA